MGGQANVCAFCTCLGGDWGDAGAGGERCGVTRSRLDDLPRGRVSRFSLDGLVDIATGPEPLGWAVWTFLELVTALAAQALACSLADSKRG